MTRRALDSGIKVLLLRLSRKNFIVFHAYGKNAHILQKKIMTICTFYAYCRSNIYIDGFINGHFKNPRQK